MSKLSFSTRIVLTSLALLPAVGLACAPASDTTTGDGDGDGDVGGDGDSGTGGLGMGDGDVGSGGGTGTGGLGGDGDGDLGTGGLGTGGGNTGTGGGNGTGGGTGGTDCSSLFLCDDFETGSIDAGTWTNILGYGNEISPSNIGTDTVTARGTTSFKVTPSGTAPVGISTAPPGNSMYLRAWIKTEGTGAGSFMAVGDASDFGQEIRLRVHGGYITLNSASGGDGLAPDPSGCSAATCVAPPTDWFCAEMYFDLASESATLWIDGQEAASVVGNVGWHSGGSFPTPARVWFGSLAPQGDAPSAIYYDDIAIGTTRIGCQ